MILWYSPAEGTIKARIEEATKYFRGRYQRKATLIHIHPLTLGEEKPDLNGIKIIEDEQLQLNHFLIGFKDERKLK